MGKASSAKKVARAARAGGRVSGVRQRNLLFPGVISAIIVLGLALIGFARADYQDRANTVSPLIGEHWHSAYGVYVCGEFVGAASEFETNVGIHSHGDDVIHIHPSTNGGAGENATMGTFLEEYNKGPNTFEVSDDTITVGEETWSEDGQGCNTEGTGACESGSGNCEDAEVVVAQWLDANDTETEPALIRSGIDDIRFRNDGQAYTIAFVSDTEDIPLPPTASQLAELGAIDGGQVTDPETGLTEDEMEQQDQGGEGEGSGGAEGEGSGDGGSGDGGGGGGDGSGGSGGSEGDASDGNAGEGSEGASEGS